MSTTSALSREGRFVQQVAGWSTTGRTGALAELRRSLSRPPGTDPSALRLILPLLGGVNERDEWRFFLVAGLSALSPNDQLTSDGSGPNLGAAFNHLAAGTNQEAVERRFIRLLDTDQGQLVYFLRQSVQQLNSAGVRWDAARLLSDLRNWSHPDRFVQRNWARQFWAATQADDKN